jgi:pentatricopeptide repeat protein
MITLSITRRLHDATKRKKDIHIWKSIFRCYHSSKDSVQTLQSDDEISEKSNVSFWLDSVTGKVIDFETETATPIILHKEDKSSVTGTEDLLHKSKKPFHRKLKKPKTIPYSAHCPEIWPKKCPTYSQQYAEEFKSVMRSREFVPAMILYARMKEKKQLPRESVLTGLLAVCQKKTHLDGALEIFNDLFLNGGHPNESAYMSLIRCYCDNGQIDEAMSLIDQMKENNLELTLRSYHPVLEEVVRKKDFKTAITIIKEMRNCDLVPRSEQLTLLLEVAALSGALKDKHSRGEVELLLHQASVDLLGMERVLMRKIISAFCDMTMEKVSEEGILIESREDLPSRILDTKSSIITAMNSTFANVPTLLHESVCSPSVIDMSVPLGFDSLSNKVTFEPEIYRIASEDGVSKNPNPMDKKDVNSVRYRRARLVDICNDTCLCPNCGGKLRALVLGESERERVRLGLVDIASSTSLHQMKNIKTFDDWLRKQNDFKYIIDGANVAYHGQKFSYKQVESGKFSYKQVELVVDEMLARGDGRVLVLLPRSYDQNIVPNSCGSYIPNEKKGRKRVTSISKNDKRIIDRFKNENMLYLVPPGADDDWYWIYATVAKDRQSMAYVVTNDLMRDHRLAFLEPRPFIHWRTTQVMSFSFSKPVKEDSDHPETFIINPAKYSREIQMSQDMEQGCLTDRWHIPASDRRAWLCLTTGTFPSSSSSPITHDEDDGGNIQSVGSDVNIQVTCPDGRADDLDQMVRLVEDATKSSRDDISTPDEFDHAKSQSIYHKKIKRIKLPFSP